MTEEPQFEEKIETSEEIVSEKETISEEQMLKNELQESKNKYLLLLADSENTRKRLQKEKVEMLRFAVENLIA